MSLKYDVCSQRQRQEVVQAAIDHVDFMRLKCL